MIKLGIEATSLCTPNRSGIANYTFNLINSKLLFSNTYNSNKWIKNNKMF